MKKFTDVDGVVCVLFSDVLKHTPEIKTTGVLKKTWDAPQGVIMAFNDAKIAVKLLHRKLTFDDVAYEDCVICSVCGEALIPDEDDAYEDITNGKVLCDAHSTFDNELLGYVRYPKNVKNHEKESL